MLSAVFWLSLAAVFVAMKWLADGLLSLATIELRRVPSARAELSEPAVEETVLVLEDAA